jgi:hypothetical protein
VAGKELTIGLAASGRRAAIGQPRMGADDTGDAAGTSCAVSRHAVRPVPGQAGASAGLLAALMTDSVHRGTNQTISSHWMTEV